MPEPSLRVARPDDWPVMERLWLMFRHDLSEFRGLLPNPDGTFRSDRLHAALDDPDWMAYVVTVANRPAGLALVRGLRGRVRVLSGFFVVRGARRSGIGLSAVRQLVAQRPGSWQVAFQDENTTAAQFWRSAARAVAGDAWSEERRPVPDRAHLPPDVWISFDVSPPPRYLPECASRVQDAKATSRRALARRLRGSP